MARRDADKGPGNPKIKIFRWADSDFSACLEVTLRPGGSIGAVERPIATTAEITSQAIAHGFSWTAPTGAKLTFALGGAANASVLTVDDENRWLVTAELAVAWTDGVTFAPVDVRGAPGLSWVSGVGKLVMRAPGFTLDLASGAGRTGFVLVDPAHFGWVFATEPTADVVVDEQGRSWIKATGRNGTIHTFDRRRSTVADAIPPHREPI